MTSRALFTIALGAIVAAFVGICSFLYNMEHGRINRLEERDEVRTLDLKDVQYNVRDTNAKLDAVSTKVDDIKATLDKWEAVVPDKTTHGGA